MRFLPAVVFLVILSACGRMKPAAPQELLFTTSLTSGTVQLDAPHETSIVVCATNQSGQILKNFEDTNQEYLVKMQKRLPNDEAFNEPKNLSFLWPGRTLERIYKNLQVPQKVAKPTPTHFRDRHFDLFPGETCELFVDISTGPDVMQAPLPIAEKLVPEEEVPPDPFRIDQPGDYRFEIYRMTGTPAKGAYVGEVTLHVLPAKQQ